ncbi:hypothetical protein F4553_006127 [Allocatelliglobosispora scoriae]|uniref:GPP34 family phosphoprotein n=1 Tax=Allocatelliglobosispora scoriae TaxID=643052 RepID=A0A841C0L6_9ACTN|nr:GPP34 family phosphoprotein [Allocatelliglobosispora scoriae]MBB5872693.1 hypothetical protein [Allocatelliglobosispora scoriae]
MQYRRLADEYFLLCHDPDSGKLHVNHEVFATGTAGAVLGELALGNRLDITPTSVTLRGAWAADDIVVDGAVAAFQAAPRVLRADQWVEILRLKAPEIIAQRLAASGDLRPEVTRGMFGREKVTSRLNPHLASMPRVRLRNGIARPDDADAGLSMLASLVLATQVEHLTELMGGGGDDRERLRSLANRHGNPGLRHLADAVREVASRIALRAFD